MQLIRLYIIFLFLCLSFINSDSSCEEIGGRTTPRKQLYRVNMPKFWKRIDPEGSLTDTTKALCEFKIPDTSIRITIHNFSSESLAQRIPPAAQLTRWKQQFERLNPTTTQVTPVAFAGFAGLYFEGSGILEDRHTTVLGWSMQIAPVHYQRLSLDPDTHEMCADFTIKVVGPSDEVGQYKHSIKHFAQTFELIDGIPVDS